MIYIYTNIVDSYTRAYINNIKSECVAVTMTFIDIFV